MRPSAYRSAFTAVAAFLLLSCSESPTEPVITEPAGGPSLTTAASIGSVVISQVYGGGGNSGATLKNDFIELHNTGTDTATITGWSVQYASGAGTSWQVTALSGRIPPGGFYLVQEALGAGGTVNLPTPDASGSIAMSATAGKVALASATTALSGTCPASAIDLVSFGTAATNCGGGTTPTLSNTNAAVRADTGCRVTGDITTDFAVALPSPRNSASPRHSCGAVVAGPLDHVALAGPANLTVGNTGQFVATPQDEGGVTVTTASVTWSSSDPSVASIDASGTVTALVASPTPVSITATAVDGAITRTATASLLVNTPSINWIDISSSSTSFPAGFQTQLFGTARVASGGTVIPATFTFEAVDSAIATVRTVANSGLVTGVAAPADGTTRPGFRVTATPTGGGTPYSFITHTILIERSNPADPSIYANNDEFGSPSPAGDDDPNDLLIERPQYTLSYNVSRGTPNWVSYELDARQMVPGQDRCNCFTADPALPDSNKIFTSDYTGGGFDRGHMTRSFDRTAGNTDNASTFYLTNIVPQMADLNQGVWAQFENALGDSASVGGRAVYIITGPLYSRGKSLTFIKGEGKVAIPDSTWKVALIGPRTGGIPFTRSAITDWSDLPGFTVMAVNMPNVAGVRNVPWATYLTTVDKIEASTGLDILSLLPTAFQDAVEAGDRRPTASFLFSGTLSEGSPISFNASASTDPDLGRTDLGRPEALAYAWDFGGDAGAGVAPSHTFGRSGNYAVTLTVTDAFGWPSTVTKNVTIANVAPVVASLTGAELLVSESYVTTGSFTDPGEGPWSATVDYGDGSGAQPLALVGKSFALSHTYATAGSFTVSVQVTDDAGAPASASTIVHVASVGTALSDLQQEITALQGNGTLSRGEANALHASLDVAVRQLGRDGLTAVRGSLGAFINKVEADVQSGRLSATVGQGLIAEVRRILAALDAA